MNWLTNPIPLFIFPSISLFCFFFLLKSAYIYTRVHTTKAGVTNVSMSLWSTVNLVAGLIPSSIAPERLNWIIMRYGFTWPAGYFFQINTFLTKFLRLKCCNRVARGGGPGGPTPFRIYVDSGVIFLCVVGLAPMVPIVAPIATIYFIVVQPMLRWLLIFVYRPRYDTGYVLYCIIYTTCVHLFVSFPFII